MQMEVKDTLEFINVMKRDMREVRFYINYSQFVTTMPRIDAWTGGKVVLVCARPKFAPGLKELLEKSGIVTTVKIPASDLAECYIEFECKASDDIIKVISMVQGMQRTASRASAFNALAQDAEHVITHASHMESSVFSRGVKAHKDAVNVMASTLNVYRNLLSK